MKRLVISIIILSLLSIFKPVKLDNTLQQSQPTLYQTKLVLSTTESTGLDTKSSLRLTNSHLLEVIPDDISHNESSCNESIQHTTNNILSVEEYFNLFPEPLCKAFFEDGWVYEKSSESLGQKFYNGTKSVLATTVFNEKHIYIDKRDCANPAILHEVGHAFEYSWRVKGVTSQEFLDLYNAHWQEWYYNYGMDILNYNTPAEGYAQCYEIYILKPECLDADTRAFIESEIYGIN